MSAAGVKQDARILAVSPEYFKTLGSAMTAGIALTGAATDARIIVVSQAFFRSTLQPNARGVGDILRVNGVPFTIVGIAAAGFSGTELEPVAGWVPHTSGIVPVSSAQTSARWSVVVRLIDPTAAGQALAQLRTRLEGNAPRPWYATGGESLRLVSLLPSLSPAEHRASQLMRLLGLTCLALALIALVNLAFLGSVHALNQEPRLAIAHALGSPVSSLLKKECATYSLLTLFGAAAGLLASRLLATPLANLLTLEPDQLRLNYGGPLSALAGMLVMVGAALLPASLALRRVANNLVPILRGHSASTSPRRRFLLLSLQVIVAAALALVATHFWADARDLRAMQLRFEPATMWVATIASRDPEHMTEAHEWRSRILQSPGVRDVAFSTLIPTEGSMSTPVQLPGTNESRMLYANAVDERYFSTAGIRLLKGRGISASDHATAPLVAVVNKTLESALLRAGVPFEQQCLGPANSPCAIRVVGVVEDSKYLDLLEAPVPFAYTALAQRANGAPIIANVRLHAASPGAPVFTREHNDVLTSGQQFRSLSDVFSARLRPWTIGLVLFSWLAALGLAIAVAGVMSVVWTLARSRTREFAIRSALGATPGSIRSLIVSQVAKWAIPSIAVGLLSGEIMSETIDNGHRSFLPLTAIAVGVVLAGVCLATSIVPVWKLSSAPSLARRFSAD